VQTESDADQDDFRFAAGRPCLDLTATVGERWGRQVERLRTPQDLARWFVRAGLADQPPEVSRQDLAHARTLREAVYRTITRRLAGRAAGPGDIAIVNDWAGRPPPRLWLEPGEEGGSLQARSDATTASALLAALARDAVTVIGDPLADRIRQCHADDCALLFLDTSRAGRRRWCSMATCGARAKMATYRARRLQATS
jgi:predicted RNA-binding Zn ribbon-like protein